MKHRLGFAMQAALGVGAGLALADAASRTVLGYAATPRELFGLGCVSALVVYVVARSAERAP